eukprot:13970984-Alexandrium_andersonii.AAC.1
MPPADYRLGPTSAEAPLLARAPGNCPALWRRGGHDRECLPHPYLGASSSGGEALGSPRPGCNGLAMGN